MLIPERIRRLLFTVTLRQSAITVISTVLNSGLAAVFYLLTARVLGPAGYGLFALAVATVAVMTVVFDFGNDRGMVRFMSKYPPETIAGRQVLKTAFLTKLASGLSVMVLFTVFSATIARLLFNQPDMAGLLPVTGLAFATQLLFYFTAYYFQAREEFIWWGVLFVGANFIRLVLAAGFALAGRLDAVTAMMLFTLTPFCFFLLGMTRVGWQFLRQRLSWPIVTEVFGFNRWVFGFSAVSAVNSRLDTYLASYYSRLGEVGVYGLAVQAVIIMPNLVSALGAVTTPKFSRFTSPTANRQYLGKSLWLFTGIALASALILMPVGLGFMLVSGREYLAGFGPFLLLLASQVIFFSLAPLRDSLLYYYSRPDFFFWASLGHGAVSLISGLWLLPRAGLAGAGLANLAGQVFLSAASVWMYRSVSKSKSISR